MSKQIKSYAEKHKFGFLDKSKKTKKVSKPKANKQNIKNFNGGHIVFNSSSRVNDWNSVPYLFRDEPITLDPFAKIEHKNIDPFYVRFVYDEITGLLQNHDVIQDHKIVKEIDVLEELEYLSTQLYNHVDVERFINENPNHISRYVSLENLGSDTLKQDELFHKYMNSIMKNQINFKAFYTDNTPLTEDVLTDFLINNLGTYIKKNILGLEDGYLYDPANYAAYTGFIIKKRLVSNIIDDLIKTNINKCIKLYKEYKTQLNILTLRDLCFFIYGIKGLQLFDTLQVLGIDHCSFEFWNSIRDGILLESTTNLSNPQSLPEFEFDFNTGGLL